MRVAEAAAAALLLCASACTHAKLAARPQRDGGAWIEVSTTFLGFTTSTDLFYCAPNDAYAAPQGSDFHRACRAPGLHRIHDGLLPTASAPAPAPAPGAAATPPPPPPPKPSIQPKD